MVLYVVGMTFTAMAHLCDYTETHGYWWTIGNIIAWVFFYSLHFFLFVQPACLTVEILLAEFRSRCEDKMKGLDFKESLEIIELFGILDKSLGFFLFIFIATAQLFFIFYTFLSYSTFFMKTNSDLSDLYFFIGLNLTSFGYDATLYGIILSCDDAFKSLKNLKKTIEKETWKTQEQDRKADLNYTLRLLDDLEPLSACGYFSVTRSTIISMVSVRCNVNTCEFPLKQKYFQLYIHHHTGSVSAGKIGMIQSNPALISCFKIVKPWPQTLSLKTQTKGPWADPTTL